jgi:hypothetical protein
MRFDRITAARPMVGFAALTATLRVLQSGHGAGACRSIVRLDHGIDQTTHRHAYQITSALKMKLTPATHSPETMILVSTVIRPFSPRV